MSSKVSAGEGAASSFDLKTFRPAGPVLKRFHESSAFTRVVAGPVGSGKTGSAGCVEMVLGALVQRPMPDGVRRAKFGVLRDNYRNLYSQFIPSWFEWFPREIGNFVGSDDRPAMHTLHGDSPLGPWEIQVEMRALGVNSVEKTCRGWNLTGCFLDEADLMPQDAFSFLTGRVKRFPQKEFRVTKGVWATFNKPDVDHFLYDWCVDNPPEDFEFFDQPPGILDGGPPYLENPAAENRDRLDDDYYTMQAKNNPPWYVKRMVRNKWGASVAGEIVYPEFAPELHMAAVELEPEPRSDIWLGLDGGGTPAAVIMGRDRYGRRIVYAEVVLVDPYDPKRRRLLYGVGPTRFTQALRDALYPRFSRCNIRLGYGDPSAFYGADREMGEFTDMETVGQRLGLPIMAAPSNEVGKRHEAVRGLLLKAMPVISPHARGLVVNPSCTWLRRGFVSDFKWEERDPKKPGATLKVQKSSTSHVHDALQYGCLGDVGSAGVTAGEAFDRHRPSQVQNDYGNPIWRTIEETARRNTPGNVSGSYDSSFDLWKS